MKNRGLTLVELLVVISILAILIGLMLPNLSDARKQARDRKRMADLRSIQQALQMYKNDQDMGTQPYPNSLPTPGSKWETGSAPYVTYMTAVPKDPLYDSDPTHYFYRYAYVVDAATNTQMYYLSACLERKEPNSANAPERAAFDDGTCTSGYWFNMSAQ